MEELEVRSWWRGRDDLSHRPKVLFQSCLLHSFLAVASLDLHPSKQNHGQRTLNISSVVSEESRGGRDIPVVSALEDEILVIAPKNDNAKERVFVVWRDCSEWCFVSQTKINGETLDERWWSRYYILCQSFIIEIPIPGRRPAQMNIERAHDAETKRLTWEPRRVVFQGIPNLQWNVPSWRRLLTNAQRDFL